MFSEGGISSSPRPPSNKFENYTGKHPLLTSLEVAVIHLKSNTLIGLRIVGNCR